MAIFVADVETFFHVLAKIVLIYLNSTKKTFFCLFYLLFFVLGG